jgi:hypothetical protein
MTVSPLISCEVIWRETRWEGEGGKEVGAEKNYHVSSATPPYPTYQVVVKAPLFPPVIELTSSYHNWEQFLQLEIVPKNRALYGTPYFLFDLYGYS